MAPKQNKRTSPLDDPPTASSSDSSGEDEIPSSQPHPEEEDDEEEASSEEQQQEEDDDDEEQQQHPPVSKNPPPTPAKPASSESDTASGSDSESDSPAPSSNFQVKASKSMEQTPKPKPKPKPSATKRPAENNGHVNDPKRSKKKKVTEATAAAAASSDDEAEAEEDVKKSGAADSKKLFQRLWSEEDEIAILKGIVEFKSKTGNNPFKYADAFHDFIKKSLHAEASSNQLKEKIRRLKKKFETNAGKGKNGQGPSFSKPRDQEAFELSKKVWGNAGAGGKANGAVEKAKSNGKSAKSPTKEASKTNVAPSKPKPESKHELTSKDSKEAEKMDIDEKIDTTSQLLEVIRVDRSFGLYGLSEDMVKRGVELIGASERAELEGQWKDLQVAELEVSVKRAELVAKQTKLILEAYKSSNY